MTLAKPPFPLAGEKSSHSSWEWQAGSGVLELGWPYLNLALWGFLLQVCPDLHLVFNPLCILHLCPVRLTSVPPLASYGHVL